MQIRSAYGSTTDDRVRMLWERRADAEYVELKGTKNGAFVCVTSPKAIMVTGLLKLSKVPNKAIAKCLGRKWTYSRPVSA